MVWNHRVVRRKYPSGETLYEIHEVYYPRVGAKPDRITLDPVDPHGETLAELIECLAMMTRATKHPVLDYDKAIKPTKKKPGKR